jgi:DNA-binding transcriptional regulator YhcF (GntR family)
MTALLHVDPTDAAPIWRQIEASVRRLVAAGALAPGAPVPSVRELARELRINPATVAKGYQRLVDAGVLTVRRGEGTYVADAPPAMAAGERDGALREGAARLAALAITLGAGRGETLGALDAAWDGFEASRKEADR